MSLNNSVQERVLVCVDYGQTGRRLIRRGGNLANKLGAELVILIFDSLPDEEYIYHKEIDISIFEELAKAYDAKIIVKKAKAIDITKTIIKTANKENVSQIILGQRVENVWTTVLGRSIIDVLLQQVPSADLHIVPSERSSAEDEWIYELGTKAFLVKNTDGTYNLQFEENNEVKYEGIFLKHTHTDFENGIFAFLSEDEKTMEVRVENRKVHSLIDIDEEHSG